MPHAKNQSCNSRTSVPLQHNLLKKAKTKPNKAHVEKSAAGEHWSPCECDASNLDHKWPQCNTYAASQPYLTGSVKLDVTSRKIGKNTGNYKAVSNLQSKIVVS
jgi:hypothetical protein